jgi:hypothetical protein
MAYNNYGTGGYGAGSQATTVATGASNPWAGLAQFIVGRMALPRSGAIDAAHEQQQKTTGGKDINADWNSPFGMADQWGAQMFPGAEKMLPVNWKPLEVGEAQQNQQPTVVDSEKPLWGPGNYLNYMKYGSGGY